MEARPARRRLLVHAPGRVYVLGDHDAHRDGTILNKMRLRRLWSKIGETMELPAWKFYWLKHAGNSYKAANGVSAAMRAATMGHADSRMAERESRVIIPKELRESVEVFNRRRAG